jgi:hypothetical protein
VVVTGRVWLKAALVLTTFAYPAGHFAFQRSVGGDPWTLGGWAMYTVPRPKIAVLVQDDRKLLDARRACPAPTSDYVSSRLVAGRLADPEPLRQCLEKAGFSRKPLWRAERRFDGKTGRFVTRREPL